MNCVVTAGPTYEPLDEVRRLTNFSTGRFGSELANYLVEHGHKVTLLLGYYAVYAEKQHAQQTKTFTTTADLDSKLRALAGRRVRAVFHAAAVSDFSFGTVWEQSLDGKLIPCKGGKLSTRQGKLLAELVPTPKVISRLRDWFPLAQIVGWKFEVDGDRSSVIAKAQQQVVENRTDACVTNGRAYGDGFGLVTRTGQCTHLASAPALYAAIEKLAREAN